MEGGNVRKSAVEDFTLYGEAPIASRYGLEEIMRANREAAWERKEAPAAVKKAGEV